MKYCVVADEPLVVPPDDEFPEEEPFEEPPEIVPEPDPVLSVEPFGKVSVTPFVENTTLPFVSVRYTDTPAEESLFNAADVGCP